MKKLLKWGAVGLLVAVAVMTVVYRAVNRVPSAELPLNEQVMRSSLMAAVSAVIQPILNCRFTLRFLWPVIS